MEKSQPFAVKLTDPSAPPPHKHSSKGKPAKVAEKVAGPSHKERMAAFQSATVSGGNVAVRPGKTAIEVGGSLEERTKLMYSGQGANAASTKKPEITGLKSIAERQAELQQAIKTQGEAQQPAAVGSIRNRLEEFKAAAEAASASKSAQRVIEGQMSIEQRKEMLLRGGKPDALEEDKAKSEPVKTGKVAEMAAKLQSKKVEAVKTGPVTVGGSLTEKMQAFQQAAKSTSEKAKDSVIDGIPSIKDRTSLLFAKPKPDDREAVVTVGSVKERASMFTSGKAWRKDEDSESSDEEHEANEAEEKLEEPAEETSVRKTKAQQSLLAKYATKGSTTSMHKPTSVANTEDKPRREDEADIDQRDIGFVDEQEQDDELEQEEIGGVPAEVGELHAEVGELPAEVGELHAEVGELPAEVGELHAEVRELHAEVGKLPAEIEELRAEIVHHSDEEVDQQPAPPLPLLDDQPLMEAIPTAAVLHSDLEPEPALKPEIQPVAAVEIHYEKGVTLAVPIEENAALQPDDQPEIIEKPENDDKYEEPRPIPAEIVAEFIPSFADAPPAAAEEPQDPLPA